MYSTIYTQMTTADMYSIPVINGNKYQAFIYDDGKKTTGGQIRRNM